MCTTVNFTAATVLGTSMVQSRTDWTSTGAGIDSKSAHLWLIRTPNPKEDVVPFRSRTTQFGEPRVFTESAGVCRKGHTEWADTCHGLHQGQNDQLSEHSWRQLVAQRTGSTAIGHSRYSRAAPGYGSGRVWSIDCTNIRLGLQRSETWSWIFERIRSRLLLLTGHTPTPTITAPEDRTRSTPITQSRHWNSWPRVCCEIFHPSLSLDVLDVGFIIVPKKIASSVLQTPKIGWVHSLWVKGF